MSGQKFREILEPLNEVHRLTPSADATQRAMMRVRESLAPQSRRSVGRIVWFIAAGLGGAAAVMALVFHRTPVVAPKIAPTPAQQLQRAVANSNDFWGMVQVQISDIVIDKNGQPQAAPKVVRAIVLTDRDTPLIFNHSDQTESAPAHTGPAVMPVQAVQQSPDPLIARNAPWVNSPSAITKLIPLTWEGVRTIPIPLTMDGVSMVPLFVGTTTLVSYSRTSGADEYRIVEKLLAEGARDGNPLLNVGTINVDPTTGLIRNMDLNSYQRGALHKQQIYYQYTNTAPATQSRTAPLSGGR